MIIKKERDFRPTSLVCGTGNRAGRPSLKRASLRGRIEPRDVPWGNPEPARQNVRATYIGDSGVAASGTAAAYVDFSAYAPTTEPRAYYQPTPARADAAPTEAQVREMMQALRTEEL